MKAALINIILKDVFFQLFLNESHSFTEKRKMIVSREESPVIDKIIRSRRRTVSLLVDEKGKLIVRAPRNAASKSIEKFILENRSWILKKQREAKEKLKELPEINFETGEKFPFMGELYQLKITENSESFFCTEEGFRISRPYKPQARDMFISWYHKQAERIIPDRVEELARNNGAAFSKIRISNADRQWGACNAKGVLSFSWRLVMAPEKALDYVITHELAHLSEMNHSRAFWEKVDEMMPDYERPRKWLRNNGHLLNII